MKIILATWNSNKLKWLTTGFDKLGLEISSLNGFEIEDVEETGNTCTDNALIKVRAVGNQQNAFVIGEDSVLSINAINGFPGVKTVRWAPGTDDDRSRLLLEKMKYIPKEKRGAKFISAVVLLLPDGTEHSFIGEQPGSISEKMVGEDGDGYQRIFISDKLERISKSDSSILQVGDHRDIAINKCCDKINEWLKLNEK
ncbi:MAG: hypothetical protein JEY94_14395 [Melioribacteraceae bacterium]|nr:hypothetical protein [Melioribacteraceae bacterium]